LVRNAELPAEVAARKAPAANPDRPLLVPQFFDDGRIGEVVDVHEAVN
jgi:hypothetical protein